MRKFMFLLKKVVIYVFMLAYMLLETVWVSMSQWLFRYTPLSLFSARVHDWLAGRSNALVLSLFLLHFIAMELSAILSGKMLMDGHLALGGALYLAKGLIAIPTVRFFSIESDRLLRFWFIAVGYRLVVWIKNTGPYQRFLHKLAEVRRLILANCRALMGQERSVIDKLYQSVKRLRRRHLARRQRARP